MSNYHVYSSRRNISLITKIHISLQVLKSQSQTYPSFKMIFKVKLTNFALAITEECPSLSTHILVVDILKDKNLDIKYVIMCLIKTAYSDCSMNISQKRELRGICM